MRSVAALIITLTFVLTCLPGCGGGGAGAVVRLLGQVRDDGSLQPIEGARVVASTGGVQGTTDVSGNFDVANFPANATAIITAAGYENTSVQLGGRTGNVDLGTLYLIPSALADTGTVIGVVTSAGGAVAEGATVRLADRQAVSREDGSYTLYNAPTGYHTVFAASADGKTSGSANVTVIESFESIANIRLSNQPPLPPS